MVQGLRQRCVLSTLLFNIFSFSARTLTYSQILPIVKSSRLVGPDTTLGCAWRSIQVMLYADDACIVLRSPRGLERVIAVSVKVFGAFGVTIYESRRRPCAC